MYYKLFLKINFFNLNSLVEGSSNHDCNLNTYNKKDKEIKVVLKIISLNAYFFIYNRLLY